MCLCILRIFKHDVGLVWAIQGVTGLRRVM